jgi:hypothetical protein
MELARGIEPPTCGLQRPRNGDLEFEVSDEEDEESRFQWDV